MKIVELDLKTWLRGERSNISYLLRPWDDKMCCLGQACLTRSIRSFLRFP